MAETLERIAKGAPKPADSVLLEKQIPDGAVAEAPTVDGAGEPSKGVLNGLFNFKGEPTTRPGNLFTEKISTEYHNSEKTGYHIPLTTLNDPGSRRLKVITIGAGFSGIMLAHDIERDCKNVEHIIYEKNSEIGGTWVQNRYPNCGCDAPSAAYQTNFALEPEWPSFYSKAEPINNYLNKVCDKLDLRKYMILNSRVTAAHFDKDKGIWNLSITQKREDGSEVEIHDDCDLLLGAIGILDRWQYPKIPGLEKFKGRVVHTAGWPKDYQAEQWKRDHVAVIGSGASAVQTVPGMQPYVKKMDVYIRTPVWFFAHVNPDGSERPQNYQYTEEEKKTFREDHDAMLAHAKQIENQTMKVPNPDL
ncbi:hypothetical protein LTS15_009467 [Exophiala xenobiotica]|nr:hypothetical protein LTS15_009467 [Exophiala xenobiotica]